MRADPPGKGTDIGWEIGLGLLLAVVVPVCYLTLILRGGRMTGSRVTGLGLSSTTLPRGELDAPFLPRPQPLQRSPEASFTALVMAAVRVCFHSRGYADISVTMHH